MKRLAHPANILTSFSNNPSPAIDIMRSMVYLLKHKDKNKGGQTNASVLCQVPRQERNEGCQSHCYEEWQASNPGGMSHLRNQDVPNRQRLVNNS